jgi:hypothetical protein
MKYIGPLLFALGVVLSISFGAKVPESMKDTAEQQIVDAKAANAAEKAAEKAKAADDKKNGVQEVEKVPGPKAAAKLRAAALETLEGKKVRDIKFEMPTTQWYFFGGILCAGAGLGVWWKEVLSSRANTNNESGDQQNPVAILKETVAAVDAYSPERDANAICQRVDELLAEFIVPMMDARQTLLTELGMNSGAEILVIEAAGERLLNRAWSAAADGDLDESIVSIGKARQAFHEAQAIVDSLE